ncbi:MAG: glycogen debranching enzyme family protein [Clostridia bacterium]|nr:glycogen debranching enzyme family protein [Clostridia bacterium]
MHFVYGRQDMPTFERAQENCYLLTNGLGGYSSLSAAFSMTRADQGLLVSARTAPNDRVTLVARLQEKLTCGARETVLSTQAFADETAPEEGYLHLCSLTVGDTPRWAYDVRGVRVTREVAMAFEGNVTAVVYTIENRTGEAAALTIRPFVLGFEKGHAPETAWPVALKNSVITAGEQTIHVATNGVLTAEKPAYVLQAYMHDAPDGRPEKGLVASCCSIRMAAPAGEKSTLTVVFSDKACALSAEAIIAEQKARMQALRAQSGLKDAVARQLVCAADAYVAQRESTGGKTILAGYPFFGDWGRDTMIALTGCTLSAGRYDDAKSILRTFLAYEKDGLVPNLFPEGTAVPMYNTVDAALLLVNVIWRYAEKTGDLTFVREAWPVMESIIRNYRKGTQHGIYMDKDGLICAGQGLDQVTWMDVRVGEILPTPRHGKPVEINAYWYSGLRIMDEFAAKLGLDRADYAALAEQVKAAFIPAFWMADKRCLKDVVSGTAADEQLRCNQIWAVTQPFTMLTPEQERAVVDAVYAHLYTPCGLRTLSPEDEQYHGVYEGEQKERDMAYHQGTTWVFPLGAYYLAYLKVYGASAAEAVREALIPMEATLREGCIGQLPEIYNGDAPAFSRGCFAQAWSVGEMLRVYEALEHIEAQG